MKFSRIHIYNDPPSSDVVRRLAAGVPEGIAGLVGTRSQKYRELGLADKKLSDEEWIDLIEREPRLLRRPILTDGHKVIVGYNEAAYTRAVGGSL